MPLIFSRFADNRSRHSAAAHLRTRRFALFRELVADLPTPINVLDIGGRGPYWRAMLSPGELEGGRFRVTLLNLVAPKENDPAFECIVGDARNLGQFGDGAFDVAYSNSTIEHVGELSDQVLMANEVLRVGVLHYVQTPNRYFPIEPHFVFPFFQFLPLSLRATLVTRFALGWMSRARDRNEALAIVGGVRLLSKRELRSLFPTSSIFEERYLGLIKSFVAHSPRRQAGVQ